MIMFTLELEISKIHFDPQNPDIYYEKLDFTEFAQTPAGRSGSTTTPAIDTDGDGYRGEFRVCDGDTFWYKGDGVPDFRADVPPPAPLMKIIPSQGKLTIRWNGYHERVICRSVHPPERFRRVPCLHGPGQTGDEPSLVAQFDYQNYNRFVMRQRANGTWDWQNKDMPFTLDSLRQWLE